MEYATVRSRALLRPQTAGATRHGRFPPERRENQAADSSAAVGAILDLRAQTAVGARMPDTRGTQLGPPAIHIESVIALDCAQS